MKKYIRTIITSLSAGLLTLTAIPLPTSAVSVPKKADNWDGTADTSWYDSKADSFSIDSAEALAGLAELVNAGDPMTGKSFYLERDLLLNDIGNYEKWDKDPPANNWECIGSAEETAFNGVFYGQGNTVCGLYQKTVQRNSGDVPYFFGGVFGMISGNAEISGIDCRSAYIHLENEAVLPEKDGFKEKSVPQAGGICAQNEGGCIKDCHFSGTVTTLAASNSSISNSAHAGGICGRSNANSTITGCSNTGTISASYATEEAELVRIYSYAGGICGFAFDANINDCRNTGAISANGFYNALSGGICGEMWQHVNIENSYNTGNISASTLSEDISSITDTPNCFAFSGGIAGVSLAKNSEQQGSILNCYSTGTVSSDGPIENAFSGGILGGGDISYPKNAALITNCYYLDTTSDRCFGMGEADDFAQSDAEMKTELFAGLLWDSFYYSPKHYPILTWESEKSPDTGDVNGDGLFSISDVVMMQKFILSGNHLTIPKAGDVCMDLKLDGFDLAAMKRLLLLAE